MKGNTALHLAVAAGCISSVDILLKKSCNPNIRNFSCQAAIHTAVELNKIEILRILICNKQTDVNIGGRNGATPLHYCAWKDHSDCARLLVIPTSDLTFSWIYLAF